ncbi:MAG TPA: hypothetical protein DCE78_06890 [Bacteroidetes bacterium]|nr:hypothetical protein [Bacteroidota bacterium]
MLSPENFYYYFREHYGYPSMDNVIFYPHFNGGKKIRDFVPYVHGNFTNQYHNLMSPNEKIKLGSIFLHDQEPMIDLIYLGSTYQERYFPNKNSNLEEMANLLRLWFPSEKSPIWCHSEKNSDEISLLNDHGFVDCYYWYHGIISLSWFNNWRWCKSLDNIEKNINPYKFLLYAREFTGTRTYRKQLVHELQDYKAHIKYDWDKQKTIHSDYSAIIDVEDASDTIIHIVAETLFDTKKQHLTEKSLKPIVMSQPFIMVSGPKSLEYLRSYGFKTFGSIWDESYDHEIDNDRRRQKIVELIKYLCNLPDQEFQKIYEKTIPIVEHNRKWFYSEKFYSILISELESNMRNAIHLRDAKFIKDPTAYTRLLNHYTKDMEKQSILLAKKYLPHLVMNY